MSNFAKFYIMTDERNQIRYVVRETRLNYHKVNEEKNATING